MNVIQNLARWYFSRRALPYWAVLILDCLIVFFAGCLAVALTEGSVNAIHHWKEVSLAMLLYLVCYMVGFRLLHTYSGILRYSTFVDLQRVAFANLVGLGLSFLMRMVLMKLAVPPVLENMDLFTAFILATMLMWMVLIFVHYC